MRSRWLNSIQVYEKFFFVFSTLSVFSAREGLIDLVAEYTPGAGAGIQSRSKASLKQFFHEFDLNIFKVYKQDFIKYE